MHKEVEKPSQTGIDSSARVISTSQFPMELDFDRYDQRLFGRGKRGPPHIWRGRRDDFEVRFFETYPGTRVIEVSRDLSSQPMDTITHVGISYDLTNRKFMDTYRMHTWGIDTHDYRPPTEHEQEVFMAIMRDILPGIKHVEPRGLNRREMKVESESFIDFVRLARDVFGVEDESLAELDAREIPNPKRPGWFGRLKRRS